MEPVEVGCRKCGYEFTTSAKTRTTCPGCKGAVTVRRAGNTSDPVTSRSIELAPTPIAILGVAIGVLVLIFGRNDN